MSLPIRNAPFVDAMFGERIISVEVSEGESLRIAFGADVDLILNDESSCCESRYFTMEEGSFEFCGARFLGAEVRDAPNCIDAADDDEEHEVQFLVLLTDRGNLSIACHNRHNGWYGGFDLQAMVQVRSLSPDAKRLLKKCFLNEPSDR